jgi:GTP-binding protein Era
MNQLVGEQLSIITPKAQTTRHRIMGMVNEPEFQIVFSDTPGIVDPAYKLHEGMMAFVLSALQDADALLIIVEAGEKKFKNEELQSKINKMGVPTLVLLNKIDLSTQEEVEAQVEKWQGEFPNASILPISALHGFQVDNVLQWIKTKLP